MRKLALAMVVATPFLAGQVHAQEAVPAAPLAQIYPVQMQQAPVERQIDGYRLLAITAGVLGGAVVTNMVVGSVVAPVVMGGGMAGMQGIGGAFMVARGALVVAGGVAGGYVGDWFYRR